MSSSRSDCTRWPLPGLCSLTGLEACPVAAHLLSLASAKLLLADKFQ
jgi:hypothetical protein